MSATETARIIRAKITVDKINPADIERLIAALPPRKARTEPESTVYMALTGAYRDAIRPSFAAYTTAQLLDVRDALTDDAGVYTDKGEGTNPDTADVIDSILSERYGVDPDADWEAWENHPDYAPTDHPEAGRRFKAATRAFWEGHDAARRAPEEDPTLWDLYTTSDMTTAEFVARFHAREDDDR